MVSTEANLEVLPVIIKVDSDNPDIQVIRAASLIIRGGGLVAYPTDTVYGLAADPFNLMATIRLFEAKIRPLNKPVPILVSSIEKAFFLGYFNDVARMLARKFWPGALTIVVEERRCFPPFITNWTRRVALRMPSSKISLILAEVCGGCIIGTSANISGMPPPTTAEGVLEQLKGKIDAIIDGGETFVKIPSTVVDVSSGKLDIVREGAIPAKSILECIRNEDFK